MRSLILLPYRIYVWLIYIPLVCVWSLLCGWTAAIVAMLISQRVGSYHVGKAWARPIGWLAPMRVSIRGAEHIEPDTSYVVVCNHASQYDIILVYGWLKLDLRWVMKQELRKVPGLGLACEKVGHIIVDRSNPEAARQSIHAALGRIGGGIGVLFFPEGTRSVDGRLKRFKSGAFRLASEHQLPILPITLLGTHEMLPAKSLDLRPGKVSMVIHPAIQPGEHSQRELMDAAGRAIASALPEDRKGHYAAG